MRNLAILIAAAVFASAAVGISGTNNLGTAHAKAHAKKGKPGRCGKYFYYDKKQRLCIDARTKR